VAGDWSDDAWDVDDDNPYEGESTLEALDFFEPEAVARDEDHSSDALGPTTDQDANRPQVMLFTVTNPPGTVSVTALMSGQPMRVDLSPRVTEMTEHQLADEIAVISALASEHARAGQHLVLSTILERLGDDRLAARTYAEHVLGLPSPETVLAHKARIFAARYADDDNEE
jgi:hypothetical protein